MVASQPLPDGRYDQMGRVPAPADAGFVLYQRGPSGFHLPIRRAADETSTSKLYTRDPPALLRQSPERGQGGRDGRVATVHLNSSLQESLKKFFLMHRGGEGEREYN